MSSSSTNTYYTYYVPSAPAAIVVAIIFFVLTALHIWRIFSTRHWFAFAIVVGGIFEFVGLAARAYSGKHLSEEGPYIVQVLLILLAPILFAASVYMFLGRLIRASGHPQLSFIRINWLTKIFVCGDIFCFFVQAAGAAQLVNADTTSEIDRAQDIILAGLALQVLFFCVFAVCAVIFHRRIHVNHFKQYIDPSVHLSMMLYSLYFCSLLITVRNVYRFIEYKSGTTGYLQEHEWPMYGLDVCLMAVIMVVTMFWYSANVKASDNEAFPLTDQESAHLANSLNTYYKTTFLNNPETREVSGPLTSALLDIVQTPGFLTAPVSRDALISSLSIAEQYMHRTYGGGDDTDVAITVRDLKFGIKVVLGMSMFFIYTLRDQLRLMYSINEGFEETSHIQKYLNEVEKVLVE